LAQPNGLFPNTNNFYLFFSAAQISAISTNNNSIATLAPTKKPQVLGKLIFCHFSLSIFEFKKWVQK
jgi:hypothetical protein